MHIERHYCYGRWTAPQLAKIRQRSDQIIYEEENDNDPSSDEDSDSEEEEDKPAAMITVMRPSRNHSGDSYDTAELVSPPAKKRIRKKKNKELSEEIPPTHGKASLVDLPSSDCTDDDRKSSTRSVECGKVVVNNEETANSKGKFIDITSYNRLPRPQENKGIDSNQFKNEVSNQHLPSSFRGGHCAMNSIYRAYYETNKHLTRLKVSVFIRQCRNMLINNNIPIEEVDEYILDGSWKDNVCSQMIIVLLAQYLETTIRVYNLEDNTHNDVGGDYGRRINIFYSNSHFSNIPNGGFKSKYEEMAAFLIDQLVEHGKGAEDQQPTIIDVSCAPGFLIRKVQEENIKRNMKNVRYVCYVYDGKDSLKVTKENEKFFKDNNFIVRKYSDHQILFKFLKQDLHNFYVNLIINDAANESNSEQIVDSINRHIKSALNTSLNRNPDYYVKTFGNPESTWEFATMYNSYCIYQGVTSGSERYYHIHQKKGDIPRITESQMYKENMQFETAHVACISKKNITSYVTDLFDNIMKENRRAIMNRVVAALDLHKGNTYRVAFAAITGYASSAKTTTAIEKYPNATFVSPTRYLAQHHMKKGVSSHTFHNILIELASGRSVGDTIIVDECSQFFVEYVCILKILAPDSRIIILGDVHQTPASNYSSKNVYTTFGDVGVINNKRETYKIPIDIADKLNNKYGFKIIPLSTANHSFYWCKSLPTVAPSKHFPIISFNKGTAEDMVSKGFNAHTITTYTGSRSHTVGFHVDSAAISSQLLNKREYVYTALTRASNKIVFIGNEAEAIIKYFAIDGHTISTYDDVNNAYVLSDMISEIAEESHADIPTSLPNEGVTTTPVEERTANEILSKVCTPSNASENFYLQLPETKSVEEGVLTTTIDQILEPPKTRKVFRILKDTSLVKKQVSDSSRRTVQTIIGRYALKNIAVTKRDIQFLKSEILNGFSKAISGRTGSISAFKEYLANNRNNRHGGINYHFNAYITSLQKKLGNNGKLKEMLDQPFNEFDECLEFFNKRQCKFDPKKGFDESDKVGQGVASMSKNVNILFSCYARYILDKTREFCRLKDRKIIIATHDSEVGLDATYTKMLSETDPETMQYKWTCNDFSEWDSRFNKVFTEVMWEFMVACGCPEYLATWFFDFRQNWMMVYRNKHGTTKLRGKSKQFSGNPFTICENTLMNMALTNCVLDIDEHVMAMYKGDDSAIKCKRSTYSAKAKKIFSITGHKAKLHTFKSGEFAGWVCTEAGLFPDIVRYSAKFLDKDYRDEQHFNDALQSLKERVTVVRDNHQKRLGCLALTEFYDDLTEGEISTLFDFIKGSLNMKFSELSSVDKHEIH
nr:MAG: RNA-dependent RNA polymerase [Chemarfal virus 160]